MECLGPIEHRESCGQEYGTVAQCHIVAHRGHVEVVSSLEAGTCVSEAARSSLEAGTCVSEAARQSKAFVVSVLLALSFSPGRSGDTSYRLRPRIVCLLPSLFGVAPCEFSTAVRRRMKKPLHELRVTMS